MAVSDCTGFFTDIFSRIFFPYIYLQIVFGKVIHFIYMVGMEKLMRLMS